MSEPDIYDLVASLHERVKILETTVTFYSVLLEMHDITCDDPRIEGETLDDQVAFVHKLLSRHRDFIEVPGSEP